MTPLRSSSDCSTVHNNSLMLGTFHDVDTGKSGEFYDTRQLVDNQVEWPVTKLVIRFNAGFRDELKYRAPT